MLKLEDCRVVFVAVGLIGVLLFASPSLGLILHFSSGEKYSELWILGPNHMAEGYPSTVQADENYLMYLGVGNHMGSSAYYGVYVKLRNESEALPDVTAGTPSPVPALYEYRVFVLDEKSWEAPLTFSFSNVSIAENLCVVGSITINDVAVDVGKSALWDSTKNAYYYELFMELWTYNASSSAFQFHRRFVGIWFNMTIGS